ncbi:hypothetical protein MYP_4504 [Sporocytophaga myxococcoides]|uniref:Lycopene cyclase domain-containing protein n=1 Tax=Sporocytophaga myxococcoides TaxID=153721 RepID=A0A098LLC8_9BACT|nr:lycopene cyclase domain-containing protein [Sporocytophaga myxococcoides]GAL87274.1 hypothetical protein MYP_4504 [Sporocytophaga myxococcoides]
MLTKYTYLLINLGSVIIPFLFSFHPKLQFYKKWHYFFGANIVVSSLFILWDMYYTHLGVWGFNPTYLTGYYVMNLPIEEILFFICIPFASVYSYHCFRIFFPSPNLPYREITGILILVLIITGGIHYDKIYTSVTFFGLAFFLLLVVFIYKTDWTASFYLAFAFLLIPFFIVNGILTGTGPEHPIVWYDNSENLGIRMLTIPVEDTFYGMLLLMGNVAVYERLQITRKVEEFTV